MELNEIRVIKEDKRGIIYDCGKSSFLSRKKEQSVPIINMKILKYFILLKES